MKIRLCHDAVKTDGVKCAIRTWGATLSRGRIYRCEKCHTYVTKAFFERRDIL